MQLGYCQRISLKGKFANYQHFKVNNHCIRKERALTNI